MAFEVSSHGGRSIAAPARVLLVANRTAATDALCDAVRARVRRGPASFHLVVPAHPHGLHKLVDPQEGDAGEAEHSLAAALPRLSEAAGTPVSGHVGDAEPLMAIADAVKPDELNASYIVPSVFDPAVAPAVAAAVRSVAMRTDGSKPAVDEP